MMEFEKQSEIMDMKEEMMNDAIDDAMGEDDDEEERCMLRGARCCSWNLQFNQSVIQCVFISVWLKSNRQSVYQFMYQTNKW